MINGYVEIHLVDQEGAPLRDKNGNFIFNLRTISNGNIFKYNAEEFT